MIGDLRAGREFPDDIFGEYRVFVTCQTNDDIPYILQYAGERSLVIFISFIVKRPSLIVKGPRPSPPMITAVPLRDKFSSMFFDSP